MTDAVRLPNRDVVETATQIADTGEIEKYLFNDIGGTELINIVRNDSVAGISVNYTIISDLTSQANTFDPTFLLINKSRYQSEFDRFGIDLSTRIPEENYYSQNTLIPEDNVGTNVYFSGTDLIIELDNMSDDEVVVLEVETTGKMYSVREYDYR